MLEEGSVPYQTKQIHSTQSNYFISVVMNCNKIHLHVLYGISGNFWNQSAPWCCCRQLDPKPKRCLWNSLGLSVRVSYSSNTPWCSVQIFLSLLIYALKFGAELPPSCRAEVKLLLLCQLSISRPGHFWQEELWSVSTIVLTLYNVRKK